MLINCLAVGCGGFIGSALRYLFSFIKAESLAFPITTLVINVLGSFAIMFFAGMLSKTLPGNERLLLFLRVGICGGFTTFSTFSAETLMLLENGNVGLGICYAAASCIMCVVAAWLGQLAASALAA